MKGYILDGKKFLIFYYYNLGSIRSTKGQDGVTWFYLDDICKILEIENPWDVDEKIEKDGICLIEVVNNLGRNQPGTFVDEGNLYQVIGRSRKPEAEPFMEWIYREVLPTINLTGAYLTDEIISELRQNPEKINEIIKENEELRNQVESCDSHTNK